jgi:hypothetical protein
VESKKFDSNVSGLTPFASSASLKYNAEPDIASETLKERAMTIEEQRSELRSQIAYHQHELEHLRDLPEEKRNFGFTQNTQALVLSLIASLQQQLSNLPARLRYVRNRIVPLKISQRDFIVDSLICPGPMRSVDQRYEIQMLLIASGYSRAVTTETYTSRVYDAISRFQVNNGFAGDGSLTQKQMEKLRVVASPVLTTWGLSAIQHPQNGVPLWVPKALIVGGAGGNRWLSRPLIGPRKYPLIYFLQETLLPRLTKCERLLSLKDI